MRLGCSGDLRSISTTRAKQEAGFRGADLPESMVLAFLCLEFFLL